VVSVPYSPATGPRVLAHDPAHVATLIDTARNHARETGASSLHILFPPEEQVIALERVGMMRRAGCQFHWSNRGYRDFDDYLAAFRAEKRKKLKRERRHVEEAGIEFTVVHGGDASDAQWEVYHRFYVSTFERLGGMATLSLEFFRELGTALPDQVVLILARHAGRYVAGAFCLRSDDALYGRHWGCDAQFNSLHFEACYYQGIDYCIRHGLQRFEPGAQGEHKVGRGFVPTLTWSTHWLADAAFRNAIADFLPRERRALNSYMEELATHLPFRRVESEACS
jgi:predicted N-acyltransferase